MYTVHYFSLGMVCTFACRCIQSLAAIHVSIGVDVFEHKYGVWTHLGARPAEDFREWFFANRAESALIHAKRAGAERRDIS